MNQILAWQLLTIDYHISFLSYSTSLSLLPKKSCLIFFFFRIRFSNPKTRFGKYFSKKKTEENDLKNFTKLPPSSAKIESSVTGLKMPMDCPNGDFSNLFLPFFKMFTLEKVWLRLPPS